MNKNQIKRIKKFNKLNSVKLIKTKYIIIIIIIMLVTLSIGYSYWNTRLSITGTIRAKSETYTILYSNIENSANYPSSVIKNAQLQITFTGNIPDSLTITIDGIQFTGFTYTNGILTISNVTGNLIITGVYSGYNKTIESTDVVSKTYVYSADLNNMNIATFLDTEFNFTNNSGRTISKIALKLYFSSDSTTSQYVYPKIQYNNTTKSPNGATSIKIYNGRTEGSVSFNNVGISAGGTFKINFPASANNSVTYPNAIITRIDVTFTFK